MIASRRLAGQGGVGADRSGVFVGIDLHKDTLTACVIDTRTGETSYKKLACKCRGQIAEFFRALPRPCAVAIETVGFYRWLWDLLEPIVDELALADAGRCRALALSRPKTDREDAFNVADLLAAGRLPCAWAPPMRVRELRDWTRHRNGLSRNHARLANRVHGILNANNRPGPKRPDAADLTRYAKAQGDKLPERHLKMLWLAIDQMSVVERQTQEAERIIGVLLAQECFARTDVLLRSIPGVGMITSATAIAEIGDFSRFRDRKQIVRYVGLNPRTFESADKQRTGRISKAGPRQLRWVLQQAAWVQRRTDKKILGWYLPRQKRLGSAKAGVALARKLLLAMWAVVRDDKPYRPMIGASMN